MGGDSVVGPAPFTMGGEGRSLLIGEAAGRGVAVAAGETPHLPFPATPPACGCWVEVPARSQFKGPKPRPADLGASKARVLWVLFFFFETVSLYIALKVLEFIRRSSWLRTQIPCLLSVGTKVVRHHTCLLKARVLIWSPLISLAEDEPYGVC